MSSNMNNVMAGGSLSLVETPIFIDCYLPHDHSYLNRQDFPEGFVFGTGTSAYQVEGASTVGGKSLSVWDDFTSRYPCKIADGSNGVVACDMYNKFKEDIGMMKKLGFDVYRFSIAWTRILPGGRINAGVNREGINYYNEIIDTVISHGMQPYVTLFHWDLPDILEKEYDGFLSKNIVKDFCEYAEVCFWEFGDRVKWWSTINEPWTYVVHGYVEGSFPPGKPSTTSIRSMKNVHPHRSIDDPTRILPMTRVSYHDTKIDRIDPAKAPYIVARCLLLCHAETVHLYRQKFQGFQRGKIGIVLNSHWFVPLNPSCEEDQAAAIRAVDFMLGWYLEPVLHGCYPKNMVNHVSCGNLEPFSDKESEMLRKSVDYLGINYYTTKYVSDDPDLEGIGYDADMKLEFHSDRNGVAIGELSGATWLNIVPWGLYELMAYLKKQYPNIPPIHITENGVADKNDFTQTPREACVDVRRTKYHQDHLYYLLKSINELHVDVRSYIIWAWCDNFEWSSGYTSRFGITYIDFNNHQRRHLKDSAMWFAKFLHNNNKKRLLQTSNKRGTEEETENNEQGPLKRLKGS